MTTRIPEENKFLEKTFSSRFFIHSLNEGMMEQPLGTMLQKGRAKPVEFNKELQEEPSWSRVNLSNKKDLPSMKYLKSNPLTTGRIQNEEGIENTASINSVHPSTLLPKPYVLTLKLNPVRLEDFLEALGSCLRQMHEMQSEQRSQLRKNLPHIHWVDGVSIEGILAVGDGKNGSSPEQVFVPIDSALIHQFYDEENEEISSLSIVEWFNEQIQDKFSNHSAAGDKTFHFFVFMQSFGQVSLPVEETRSEGFSAFHPIHSPLTRLNVDLGFRHSKL